MTTEKVEKEISEDELRARINGSNVVLDKLTEKLGLKNDAALARVMQVAPPVISKLRHGRFPFGSGYIIRAHELTNEEWSIAQIKEWLGLPALQRHYPMQQAA